MPNKSKETLKGTGFRQFRKLCAAISSQSEPDAKVKEIRQFFGIPTDPLPTDFGVWLRCLLPNPAHHANPMDDDQLLELFNEVFQLPAGTLKEQSQDLDTSDVADVIVASFESSAENSPAVKSLVTIQEVDAALCAIRRTTNLTARADIVRNVIRWSTSNDLRVFIHILRHDLMMDADAKLILDAVGEGMHDIYVQNGGNVNELMDHLTPTTSENEDAITNFLPNFFTDTAICLDKSIVHADELKRYIIAYNGQVLPEKDGGRSDFYVTNQKQARSLIGRRMVRQAWLLDCIKAQSKIDYHPYLI